jgi:hypothetical protein
MTVEEHDRIDIVARKDGTITLVMVEARPWSMAEEIREDLRMKILNYATYARSEQYRDEHGDAPVAFLLAHQEPAPPEIVSMLENASADLGIPIGHTAMGEGGP